jgi:hypothetical protein
MPLKIELQMLVSFHLAFSHQNPFAQITHFALGFLATYVEQVLV